MELPHILPDGSSLLCCGAECSVCAPSYLRAIPAHACVTCGTAVRHRERYQWQAQGRNVAPLCHGCYEEYARNVRPQVTAIANKGQRLFAMRDSRGEPVPHWPDKVVPSVTAIIWHPERTHVLCLLGRNSRMWGCPGGACEPGETLQEAVSRETFEETRLHVTVSDLVAVDAHPEQYAVTVYQNAIVHYVALTFLCYAQSTDWHLCHESLMGRWCLPHELPTPMRPAHQWRLEQALRHTHTIPVR